MRLSVTSGPHAGDYIEVTDELTIGREGTDIVLDDAELSRRHASFRPTADGLEVTDLDSTNGTWIGDRRVEGTETLRDGDEVRIGTTRLVVEAEDRAAPEPAPEPAAPREAAAPPEPEPAAPPEPEPATAPQPVAPARPSAMLEQLTAVAGDGIVVRYRPGTIGERAAPSMVELAGRAVENLKLGAPGPEPQILLVDPLPNPANPDGMITSGSVVDPENGAVWMVVTAEAPPEPPERPLAVLLGSRLPAGAKLIALFEGWGLHVAGAPDPDPMFEGQPLPPIVSADGELRLAMSVSFVRHLIRESSEEKFLNFLRTAQPERVDDAAQEAFGFSLAVIEERWRRGVSEGAPPMKTGQFLQLAKRFLRPHYKRQAEIFVWMLLGLAFTVVFPFAFKRLLDTAIPSGEFSQVATILALLGAAFVVTLIAGLRRSYLTAYVSSAVIRDLRKKMFHRIQALEPGWFARRDAGDVIARMFNDVEQLEAGLSQSLREGTFQMISLIVSAIVLLTLNPILGAIVLLGAPLVALVYRLMAKEAQRRSMLVQQQIGQVTSVANENYGAQPVVKAFRLEGREVDRFDRASDRLFTSEVRVQLFGGLFSLSVELIVTLLRLTVLALGAYLIFEGHLTVGALVAFISLMGEVLAPVTVLTGIGAQIQQSTGALVRINEVLDATPTIYDAPNARELPRLSQQIELRDVSFAYTPERRTLKNLSCTIPAGSKVAFVGPSGAGKSSVLQLLMRFYDPVEGAVLVDGIDLREATLDSLRDQLGVVFQETFLFNTTIRENIELGKPGATMDEIVEAAKAARLHDAVEAMPEGYDSVVGERGGRLSGGQKQRLAIARALLRDPAILVLDEATSALDPRTEALISETLEDVSKGRTTVAVTHRLTSITDYDRIFVISAGELVEQGRHDELVAMGGVYANLWAEQTGAIAPAQTALDVPAALARLPLFSDLDEGQLGTVAQRMRTLELNGGQTIQEGGGRLALVHSGRATRLVPSLGGDPVPEAQLGSGDSFGLAAILGEETGAELRADGPVSLLVLEDEAIAGLAAEFPSVRAALSGQANGVAPAASGVRLAPASAVIQRPPPRSPVGSANLAAAAAMSGMRPSMVVERVSRVMNRIPVGTR